MTDAETKERTALAREWVRWNGRTGTEEQVDKVVYSPIPLETLRRMCAERVTRGTAS